MVNMLPLPWWLRLLWLRLLYFATVKGTLAVPAILRFVERQNAIYQMGKQRGGSYESFVVFDEVLRHLESAGVDVERVKEAIADAKALEIPQDEYGTFLARALLDRGTAERVLNEAFQSTRY